ncbi:MAG: methyltransferase [Planctomycetota bacterium]|nr:MAG: methyltransferase [Planctomycetota bacterium]
MPRTPWFIDAFTADYLEVYAHRDEAAAAREVRGALGLLEHEGGQHRLLDLAAGAGRHSLAMAAEGCDVTCLDLSADLTERCAALGLRTVRADMRQLPWRDWAFDRVTCLFSSFGYFETDEQHLGVLREIARVLAPGGRALIDLMDPDTVERKLVPQSVDVLPGGAVVEVERSLVRGGERVEKHIHYVKNGQGGKRWSESVRLFRGPEIEAMTRAAGFEIERTVGDYDGRAHVPGETRRLLVLRVDR